MSQTAQKNIDSALIQLATVVAGMIGYVEEQIICITDGMTHNNHHQIQKTMDYIKPVQKLSYETTIKTIELFVNFKPKGEAGQLALISWRIAVALERISALLNEAGKIALNVKMQDISGAMTAFENIKNALMSQTYNMVIAYTAHRPDLIDQIIEKEVHIRNVYKSFFKEMIMLLLEKPELTSHVQECLSLAQRFEITAIYMHEITTYLTKKFEKNTKI